MRNSLLSILLILSLNLEAKVKADRVIGFSCIYLAGASYGLRETILWHLLTVINTTMQVC